jgi:glycosyltransferase involved in cell wall biosynthesis
MQELAQELSDRGHDVTVATTYPSMNLAGHITPAHYPECSRENSVRVIRMKTGLHPHLKGNFFRRGLSQLILPYVYVFKLKKYFKDKIDAVIVYSPPLTLSIAGSKIKQNYCARFILNVQDIFPQNAVDLGILKSPALIHFFERIERRAYQNCDVITVHSPGNLDLLTQRDNFPVAKTVILPNWIDIDGFPEAADNFIFRKQLDLTDKFIFFFGGVLGPSQGLDLIVRAAKELEKYTDIVFLLAGDGLEKQSLKALARHLALKNIVFHPFVSRTDYRRLLNEIDVGLVCLSAKNKTPVVPGKLLGYMAASVPVAAVLNRESDGHHIVRESGCGVSEVSEDVKRAAALLLKIYQDRNQLRQYGANGHRYAVEHFSKRVCIDKIEAMLT